MNIDLSIVVPIKNEQENIETLAGEITRALAGTSLVWEVVWVNDGSTDDSVGILESISAKDARHRYTTLAQSGGQSAALVEGFLQAQSSILATIDGDGQNDPADIPTLLSHLLKTKADMVNGRRYERRDNFFRKVVSGLGNRFRNVITGEKLNDVGCGLRVFHRRCIKDLSIQKEMRGMHRFLPTVSRLNGYRRIEELPVNHRPRQRGLSKYGVIRRFPDFIHDTLVIGKRLRALPKSPRSSGRPAIDRRQA